MPADAFDAATAHSRFVSRLAAAGFTDRERFNALAAEPFTRERMRAALQQAGSGPAPAMAAPLALAVRMRAS